MMLNALFVKLLEIIFVSTLRSEATDGYFIASSYEGGKSSTFIGAMTCSLQIEGIV